MQQQVAITETVLRDGHQSLMATRLSIEDMLPVLTILDKIGYYSLECWGGATFDACIRFLNEDPWERLRTLKKGLPNTRLQMLLRGQNLLGYRHYADDIVDKFISLSAQNGIDVFRIFDALNDPRNIRQALSAVKKTGKEAQLCIAYTTSPVHTLDYYLSLVKELVEMGADSICIKDMAGILTPKAAKELVAGIKAITNLPLIVHTHATSGISQMTYLAAVEAGADRIDTALSPFSEGTSQPATESMYLALKEAGYDITLDETLLEQAANHLRQARQKYLADGILDPSLLFPDPRTLQYQVPGGMLSNLLSQLTEQGLADKYEEVLAEVPKVRADLGYPPLVTPLSQMVGTQALMNIISGERYKVVPNEIKDYVRGLYGQSSAPLAEGIKEKIIGDEAVIACRPADLIEPQLVYLRDEIAQYARSEEDVLSYASFPQQARDFLGRREDPFYDVPVQEVTVQLDIQD
ncbi:oxaloacetate decarboxylase subunit alpha [Streptococcus dysgalactiae]|uniref:Oxaloacetate decarboxylase subunit alpha n=1 Tax=Streptococcus dysgalactiae subsp. equisimilis TaxID=119602 RepID=A0AB38Y3U0_STREQ|nr:oxaloacetate decarboxylase subunit alpha [Streptococcus dysgalactiae]QQY16984.1 oxaloacetate decarboxylase subunit alpha [Streptococcus dysgalactiae]WEQ80421.1 oxaloacetate decarboxylase subunit alpha OadA [Streptococcus dysgalactiae subsp. equisimilis]WHM80130.1 oxaloacetate decarboxylase subunit alpha [Streptococcus dysgalactiae subsp. equisimilis]WJD53178.1 oxaloacetate decarboxylase subunit alpha [Streptococcus dysgalactiae subsp. equisimilis]GET68722.1 putative transcarboxylase subunit